MRNASAYALQFREDMPFITVDVLLLARTSGCKDHEKGGHWNDGKLFRDDRVRTETNTLDVAIDLKGTCGSDRWRTPALVK